MTQEARGMLLRVAANEERRTARAFGQTLAKVARAVSDATPSAAALAAAMQTCEDELHARPRSAYGAAGRADTAAAGHPSSPAQRQRDDLVETHALWKELRDQGGWPLLNAMVKDVISEDFPVLHLLCHLCAHLSLIHI